MSPAVYEKISDEFMMRMRNWARANAGEGLYASSSAFTLIRGASYGASGVPVMIGEAIDTGACLRKLPIRYRQAVELFWQYEGARPMAWFGRRLAIDYRTYERRVVQGHDLLKSEFSRHYAAIRAYKKQFREEFPLDNVKM